MERTDLPEKFSTSIRVSCFCNFPQQAIFDDTAPEIYHTAQRALCMKQNSSPELETEKRQYPIFLSLLTVSFVLFIPTF